jgi:hypothetical protein
MIVVREVGMGGMAVGADVSSRRRRSYVAALVVAMPLSDMAKVADRSSSNVRRGRSRPWIDWNESACNGAPIHGPMIGLLILSAQPE